MILKSHLMTHVRCHLQASPEKPKRPISAMFIFSEEKRPKLQQERPDLSDSELTRLLARMWNELPDKKKVTCCPEVKGASLHTGDRLTHRYFVWRRRRSSNAWRRS